MFQYSRRSQFTQRPSTKSDKLAISPRIHKPGEYSRQLPPERNISSRVHVFQRAKDKNVPRIPDILILPCLSVNIEIASIEYTSILNLSHTLVPNTLT